MTTKKVQELRVLPIGDLEYLSIGTRDRPGVVEYSDSAEYLAMVAGTLADGGAQRFGCMHRAVDDLDHRDGEP